MKKGLIKKVKLSQLIESADWDKLGSPGRMGRSKITENEIMIAFVKRYKAVSNSILIRLRIGGGIIEKLKWEKGDKILPMINKDDESIFLLVKPDSNVGFSLMKEAKSHAYLLNFTWTGKTILEYRAMKLVNHEISKNKIIFQV